MRIKIIFSTLYFYCIFSVEENENYKKNDSKFSIVSSNKEQERENSLESVTIYINESDLSINNIGASFEDNHRKSKVVPLYAEENQFAVDHYEGFDNLKNLMNFFYLTKHKRFYLYPVFLSKILIFSVNNIYYCKYIVKNEINKESYYYFIIFSCNKKKGIYSGFFQDLCDIGSYRKYNKSFKINFIINKDNCEVNFCVEIVKNSSLMVYQIFFNKHEREKKIDSVVMKLDGVPLLFNDIDSFNLFLKKV